MAGHTLQTTSARLLGAILVVASGGCGIVLDADGPTGELRIDAAGGTVRTIQGASVAIPPGAIAGAPVVIQMQEVGTPAPLPQGMTLYGGVYALTPHGQVFASPVTVTLPAPAGATSAQLLRLDKPGATTWTVVSGITRLNGSVQVQTTHFSFYAVVLEVNPCGYQNGGCDPKATCSDVNGQPSCACETGYSGDGVTCAPVDACASGNGGCDPHATCAATGPGTRSCTCPPGFPGDGITCMALTCEQILPNCGANAKCSTAFGTAGCVCDPGYSGDGVTCTRLSCTNNAAGCDPHATCSSMAGSQVCTCGRGYAGDGFTCAAKCGGALVCGTNATCHEVFSGSYCACNDGYSGDGQLCTPLACTDHNGGCDANATCSDASGVDHCVCNANYAGDGLVCCSGGCDANATCSLVSGSPRCVCNGYYVGDGTTCTELPCSQNNGGCDTHATCFDPSHVCQCGAGWSGTGAVCFDIDECQAYYGPCDPNATCTNTPGSYSCACNPGFIGNGATCAPEPCSMSNGGCDSNADCSEAAGNPHCLCRPGFAGDGFSCVAG